jgi:hypothetical protein
MTKILKNNTNCLWRVPENKMACDTKKLKSRQ